MKQLPPLQWLRVFEAAARHLSFTHAATELHITQSAVSQQIKLLENHLGHNLFIRRARSLQLTDSGFLYLPDIQSALAILQQSTRAHFGQPDKESITVHCKWAFSVGWLSSHIQQFLNLYPTLSINIIPTLWESDYRQKSDTIEIHFGMGYTVENKVLLTQGLCCYPVCSPTLAKKLKHLEDLLDYPQINIIGTMNQWNDFYTHYGIEKVSSNKQQKHSTPSYMLALEMAQHNIGIALAHDVIANNLLSSGRLVKPFDKVMPIEENYYLVYQEDKLSSTERNFCDWLINAFQKTQ